MRKKLVLLAIVAGLTVPSALSAQSLAGVAAAEAARRKAQKAPTKVYTNDTLAGTQSAEVTPVPAPSEADKSAAAKPAAAANATTGGAAKTEPVDEKKTEVYWKSRVTTIQQTLGRNNVLMQALQSRINALNTEALNADDPGRHATAQANLTTAVNEMERLKQETAKLNKDLASLQEEARRASIPPGWLR